MNDNQGRGGRGRSGGGRSHNNNNNRNNENENDNEKNEIRAPEDACKDMGQNFHVVGKTDQADKCVKTTEVILNHMRANCKRSEDVVMALRKLEDIEWTEHPDKPTAPASKTGKIDFNTQEGYECEAEFESFQRRKEQCITNRSDAQGLIYNQCTKEVKNKLEARSDFMFCKTIHSNC